MSANNEHTMEEQTSHLGATFLLTLKNKVNMVVRAPSSQSILEYYRSEFNNRLETYLTGVNALINDTNVPAYKKYIQCYAEPEIIKDVLVYHRDCLFELARGIEFVKDELVDAQTIVELSQQIANGLAETIEATILLLHTETVKVKNTPLKKVAFNLSTYTNPWQIYNVQFTEIHNQVADLLLLSTNIENPRSVFSALKTEIEQCVASNVALLQFVKEGVKFEEEETVDTSIEKTKNFISHLDKKGNRDASWGANANNLIETFKINKSPVALAAGELQVRNLDLKKVIRKWLELEIVPVYAELASREELFKSRITNTFTNLLNNLKIAESKETSIQVELVANHQRRLSDEISDFNEHVSKLKERLETLANENLCASYLLQENSIFEVSFNRALNVQSASSYTFTKNKLKNKYRAALGKYDAEFFVSKSTKLVVNQIISKRIYQEENEQYDSIFLNRGYVGELFLLERPKLKKQAQQAVELWKEGFQASLLIKGNPLSGRSSFASHFAKTHFKSNVINLKPNQNATIDGRKFSTGYDLKEALLYIKNNNSKSTLPVVVIDDLESWNNEEHRFLKNARNLLRFIEKNGKDLFVIVVAKSMVVKNLQANLNFEEVFTISLDVSKAEEQIVVNSLLLRHGGAQHTLFDIEGEELGHERIERYAGKLARHCNYNIGETLQQWTFMTEQQTNGAVKFEFKPDVLPDVFSLNERIILTQILNNNGIEDKELKERMPHDFGKYSDAINRLFGSKILIRTKHNKIQISPLVQNDIIQSL